MSIAKLPALSRAKRRALKAWVLGFACIAGLALIGIAQITLDRTAPDVDSDPILLANRGE
jgi:hypothetical protein